MGQPKKNLKQYQDEARRAGIEIAASVADEYNSSSTHSHMLGDCILARLNLIGDKKPRVNVYAQNIKPTLRGDNQRCNLEKTPAGVRVCWGLHEKNEACQWENYRTEDPDAIEKEVHIVKKVWARNDDYHVVPEIQVDHLMNDVKDGDCVKVTIQKLTGVRRGSRT